MRRKYTFGMILMIAFILTFWLSSSTVRAEQSGDYTYRILEDGTAEITGYTGEGTVRQVEIPQTVDGYAVTSIGEYAFSTAKLSSVTIPKGLTSIENGVFTNAQFESVIIPEGVTSIGDAAFAECASLKSVTLPESLTSIGKEAFIVTALKEVEIPAGVRKIGEKAFGYMGESKINGFAIYGVKDTAADIYAYDNGFDFIVGHGECGDHLRWKLNNHGVLTISGTGDMWDYTKEEHPDWYGRGIATVVLEEGVTSIGNCAFYHGQIVLDNKY